MHYKILFVDDESANLRLLERLFRSSYEVLTASNADEGLKLLELHDVALIVSDQRMPAMNGSDFLKLAAGLRPQTVRIMLTGYTDANDLVDAINSGVVYKYVTKPWVNEELQQTVKRALQHYETTKAQRQLQLLCERLQTRLLATRDGFVEVVLTMLEKNVPESREHARRTADVSAAIGARLDLERPDIDTLTLAARLHEAARFCTPRKKDDPAAAGRQHESGVDLLDKIPGLTEVAALMRYCQERYDGSGYPAGFAGAQIPIGARILSVAEAYDKLRHAHGLDFAAMTHEDAVRVLACESGKRYDPEVIDALRGLPGVTEVPAESELLITA